MRFEDVSDDQLWERWRGRLESARGEFHELAESQLRFRQLMSVVRSNERLQAVGGPFLDWIVRSHAYASVAAVRRHAIGISNDLSLQTMLHEIRKRPHVINRARYYAAWGDDDGYGEMRPFIRSVMFDGFPMVAGPAGPLSDHLDSSAVASHLERLNVFTEVVVDWANANVTHRTDRVVPEVQFSDLNEAIEQIFRIFETYYALLTLAGIEMTPVDAEDALECFTFPWLVDARVEDDE